jgi:hypothetical protein
VLQAGLSARIFGQADRLQYWWGFRDQKDGKDRRPGEGESFPAAVRGFEEGPEIEAVEGGDDGF